MYVAPRRSVSQDSRERRRQPPGAGTSHNICICSEPVGARPRPSPPAPRRGAGSGEDGQTAAHGFSPLRFGRATSHRISIARTSLRNTILKCCVLLDSISQARQGLARGTLEAESGDIRGGPRFIRGGEGVAPTSRDGPCLLHRGASRGIDWIVLLISMSMYGPDRIHTGATGAAPTPTGERGARAVWCARRVP